MARIAEHPPTRAAKHQKAGVDPAPAMRARLARAIALTAFSVLVMTGMPLLGLTPLVLTPSYAARARLACRCS